MSLLLLHADLDAFDGDPSCLDAAERARVARKRDPLQRARQQAALVFVRHCLARHLDLPPARLPLQRSEGGKPMLDPAGWAALGRHDDPPHYNLSHCGGLALLAIAAAPVGVDLEARIVAARPALAAKLLTDTERQAWERLDATTAVEALTIVWVRKEAVLKATGLGLRFGLRRLSVGWAVGGACVDLGAAGHWRVEDVEVRAGYRAAVALPEGSVGRLPRPVGIRS